MIRVASIPRRWGFALVSTAGLAAVLASVPPGSALPPAKPAEVHSPLTPAEAQKLFHVAPGLRVELVAAEPDIESPVAMAFDEDGKLWVVEMPDYPNGPPPGKPAEGRVCVLEDRDGSGRYRHHTVFADHLLFANGVMPWRGGAVVTAAPNILFLKDTDGDGKADRRDVLYEGFTAQNPQLRVNHPILGPDNWIYVANGLRGGQVRRAGKPAMKPINLSGMDFRFDLIHDRAEAISGMGQYGNAFDDWGRRFVCDNRHHLRHIVLPNHYVKRNPFLAVSEVLEDTSELPLGAAGAGAKVYPLSKNWTTSNLHAGRFTAACSVFIYRGNLLPAEFRGTAFTCEPTGNLIHREILEPRGATFRSHPARPGVEFLATPDDWCRPVFMADGPDGALYVVDMYRAVIEHPDFMPPELKHRPDLTFGKHRGRIWRIVPENYHGKPVRPHLSTATTPELVALLTHPNAWWRTTAQRLLLQRQDRAAIEPLHKLVASADHPLARIHAAWLLEELGALGEKLVLCLLGDTHPQVRTQGLRLSERRLAQSPPLQDRVRALAADPDAQVRFQTALTLGAWDDERTLPSLARIALAAPEDHWTRVAVATAVPHRAGALIATLLQQGLAKQTQPGRFALLQELAALVGSRRDPAEVAGVLDALLALTGGEAVRWQMAGLTGLADGMGRRGTQLGVFVKTLPEPRASRTGRIGHFLDQAAALAADRKNPLPERLTAVRLLAHAPWKAAEPVLTRLLAEDPEQEIRLAAVRALAAHPEPSVAGLLMKAWRGYTPALRREVTEVMFRQPDRIMVFLDEVQAGRVKPADLDPTRTRQVLNHRRPDIRERAHKLLQGSLPADRKKVLESYQRALTLKGDPKKGRMVFQKNCATCHHVAGVGVEVGPDISDSRTKTAAALLVDILSPNQAIDSNYINYNVTTKSGKFLTGIIVAETASNITLRRAERQTDVVLRQDIDEIQSTGMSLMPEGFEKTISVPDMADLLAFLKNWRYLDGAVPLTGGTKPDKK